MLTLTVKFRNAPREGTFSRIIRAAAEWLRQVVQGSFRLAGQELDDFGAAFEKSPAFFFIFFSIVYFIGSLSISLHKKVWLDEIATGYIANLPSVWDIWSALLNTVDSNPPLYYLAVRPFLAAFPTDLAIRIPSVIGFWIAALCVFSFVRRRSSVTAGAVAALVFTGTGAFTWASEGRPYGLVLGLTGIALLLWQRAVEGRERRSLLLTGLALVMACLVATHYYSLLLLGPLFFGEITRAVVRKRLDLPLYLAVALGCATMLFWLPLLHGLRQNLAIETSSRGYFAYPSFAQMHVTYVTLLHPLLTPMLVCTAAALAWLRGTRAGPSVPSALPAHEMAAVFGLVAIPAIALVGAVTVTHAFVVRYGIAGGLGLGMLAGLLLYHGFGASRAFSSAVLVIIAASVGLPLLADLTYRDTDYEGVLRSFSSIAGDAPIVVTEGLLFAPLWHYAAEPLRTRVFYVTDLGTAQETTDITNEIITIKLKPLFRESVVDIDDFVRKYRTFFLYYSGESANSSIEAVMKRQCRVSLAKKEGTQLFLRCECPGL